MGGGGERMRFGVILTMGLLVCFDVDGSICLVSGDGVDGRAGTSGLQPGVSAISRTASDDLCCWRCRSKRGRGSCLGVTSNLESFEAG